MGRSPFSRAFLSWFRQQSRVIIKTIMQTTNCIFLKRPGFHGGVHQSRAAHVRRRAGFLSPCRCDGLFDKYNPALKPAAQLTSYPMTFAALSRSALVSGEARAPFDSFMCGELWHVELRNSWRETSSYFHSKQAAVKACAPPPAPLNSGLFSRPSLKGPINNLTSFLKD